MIQVEDKLIRQKVVLSPMYKDLDDSIEFLIVGQITLYGFIEFFAKQYNWVPSGLNMPPIYTSYTLPNTSYGLKKSEF